MNHFEMFNLPADFVVDTQQLAVSYQQLQRLTHPDRFATASEQQRLLAMQKNAQLNDAYQTLKSPLRRAEYLLSLRGMDLNHEQLTVQDKAFLFQQMEWREQLEEIEQRSDLDELETLDDELAEQVNQQLGQLQQWLEDDSQTSRDQAADAIAKLKFFYKLRQQVDILEEKLQD